MATEADWIVLPSNFTNSAGSTIYNSPINNIFGDALSSIDSTCLEPRGLQIGAEYLYNLKEHLVSAGWTVVASSYRKNYNFNGNIGYYTIVGTEAKGTEMSAGCSVTNLNAISDMDNYFETSAGDNWQPSKIDPILTQWDDVNAPYKVIYPGPVNFLYYDDKANTKLIDLKNRRGVWSGLSIGSRIDPSSTLNNNTTYYRFGRSWCLLKAPQNFIESQAKNNPATDPNYHIVLDYAHPYLPVAPAGSGTPPEASAFPTVFYKTLTATGKFSDFISNDYNSKFGSFMNIVILPDYNPGDAYTNIDYDGINTYTPNAFQRPSHVNEIGCTSRATTTQTNYGLKYFRFIGDDTSGKYFVNTIHTDLSTNYGGTFLLGSVSGAPTFTVGIAPIADPLSPDIIHSNKTNQDYAGEKFFLFWSNLDRGGNINKTATVGITNKTTLSASIFDASDEYPSMYYYSNYSPNKTSNKYSSDILNTCAPVMLADTKKNTSLPSMVLASAPFSKVTSDYTYMEWPLPLISVQGYSNNFKYAGRMMDVKLGPAGAQTGILAQESGSVQYDRILWSGIWLPYSGLGTLLF